MKRSKRKTCINKIQDMTKQLNCLAFKFTVIQLGKKSIDYITHKHKGHHALLWLQSHHSLNRSFIIRLLHVLALYHVIWNNFPRNSPDSKKIFCAQNKIIEMSGIESWVSCGELSMKFTILHLASEFILPLLLLFVVDNVEMFQTNSDIRNVSTRYRYKPNAPTTTIIIYHERRVCY
jgi:hypothetical protein